jgi:hypothetical protein
MAAPFSPRALVDLLCTLARKSGFSAEVDALALAEPVSLVGPLPIVAPAELSI